MTFEFLGHQKELLGLPIHSCLLEGFENQCQRHTSTLKTVVLIFLGNAHYDDALVESIVENAFDLLVDTFVQEDGDMGVLGEDGAPAVFEESHDHSWELKQTLVGLLLLQELLKLFQAWM